MMGGQPPLEIDICIREIDNGFLLTIESRGLYRKSYVKDLAIAGNRIKTFFKKLEEKKIKKGEKS